MNNRKKGKAMSKREKVSLKDERVWIGRQVIIHVKMENDN